MSNDPWADGDDGQDEGSSYPKIRIDRAHPGTSRFGIKVSSISEVREGEYSDYVLIAGELLHQTDAAGGTQDDPEPAPEVGTEVQFLVPFQQDPEGRVPHIQEEVDKALRRVKSRGFLKVGDEFHLKLLELQEKNSKGKKYPKGKEFGKHGVRVVRPAPDFPEDGDAPW